MTVSQTALEELSFWSVFAGIPFKGPIGPPPREVRIHKATNASGGAWSVVLLGVLYQQIPEQARTRVFFTLEEKRESSTLERYWEFLVPCYLFISLCQGAEVFIQTDS